MTSASRVGSKIRKSFLFPISTAWKHNYIISISMKPNIFKTVTLLALQEKHERKCMQFEFLIFFPLRKRSFTLIHLICPILISRDTYHTARYSIDHSSFQHIFQAYLISSHLTNSLLRPNKQPETRLASLPQDTKEDRTFQCHFALPEIRNLQAYRHSQKTV